MRRRSAFDRGRSAFEHRILNAETKRGADSGKIKLKRSVEWIWEKLNENKLLNQAFSVDFNKGFFLKQIYCRDLLVDHLGHVDGHTALVVEPTNNRSEHLLS